MRRSVLRPEWYVSTEDPKNVVETCLTRDFARFRAAKLSLCGKRFFVWEWNPENGLRRVKASADGGKVFWHKPCRLCDERGCDGCEYLGSTVDPGAPIEKNGDVL